jgi:hypothetical protein
MNPHFPPPPADTISRMQCCAACIELALYFLDLGDEPSARFVVEEAVARFGEQAPRSLHALEAMLRLTASFGENGYLQLCGHRISIGIDSPPSTDSLPSRRFVN